MCQDMVWLCLGSICAWYVNSEKIKQNTQDPGRNIPTLPSGTKNSIVQFFSKNVFFIWNKYK